jgi:hypothetical protein
MRYGAERSARGWLSRASSTKCSAKPSAFVSSQPSPPDVRTAGSAGPPFFPFTRRERTRTMHPTTAPAQGVAHATGEVRFADYYHPVPAVRHAHGAYLYARKLADTTRSERHIDMRDRCRREYEKVLAREGQGVDRLAPDRLAPDRLAPLRGAHRYARNRAPAAASEAARVERVAAEMRARRRAYIDEGGAADVAASTFDATLRRAAEAVSRAKAEAAKAADAEYRARLALANEERRRMRARRPPRPQRADVRRARPTHRRRTPRRATRLALAAMASAGDPLPPPDEPPAPRAHDLLTGGVP